MRMHRMHRSTVRNSTLDAGPRLRHAGGAGKTGNAAPQPSPNIGSRSTSAEGQPVHQARLEAWDGEPGDRIHDQISMSRNDKPALATASVATLSKQRQGVMLKRPV